MKLTKLTRIPDKRLLPNKKEVASLRSSLWYFANKFNPRVIADRRASLIRWRKENPQKYLWQGAKSRAKLIKVPFDLEPSDIEVPDKCPVLDVPFKFGTPYAMSLDRKISSLGYTKGNVQVISRKANLMKQDASVEELRNFAKWASTFKT